MNMRLVCLLIAGMSAFGQSLSGDWVNEHWKLDARGWVRMHLEQTGPALKATGGDGEMTGTFRDGKISLEGKKGKASGTLENGEIHGSAVLDGDEVQWRAYRESSKPAAPVTHTFEPKEFHRVFTGTIAPVLRINSGDTVKTWTVDAGGNDANGKKRSNGGNPETGPFYVEGALPGDQLAVKLTRVRPNRDSASSGGRIVASALNPYYLMNLEQVKNFDSEWTLDREKGIARLKNPTPKLKDFTVPLRPMMGCIAVAPPGEMTFRSGFLGAYGGNMDYNEVREGVTLYLPVFRPGALLFIGDGHAAQGDGELTGDALETSMDVEFTVEVIRDGSRGQNGPRMESADYLMAMGIAGSLPDAFQAGTTELSKWLAKEYGLNPSEVAMVLGSSIRYDIAEVVDPYVNVVAKVSKKALATLSKKQP